MTISWLKTGQESQKIAQRDEAEREAYQEGRGKLRRFFLKEKETAKITFVDGNLTQTPEGAFLLPPRFYEHMRQVGPRQYENYVCPEKTDPESGHKCPLCEGGDRPSLVALFTVIDHRAVPSKDNKRVYKDQKRLLVAKPLTMEILTKMAIKRGGLAGCTFEVSRMGENSAAVGSLFEFEEKNEIEKLQAAFVQEVEEDGKKVVKTYFTPADYEQEIIFRTPEDMLKLGLGKAPAAAGMASPGGSMGATDYSSKL